MRTYLIIAYWLKGAVNICPLPQNDLSSGEGYTQFVAQINIGIQDKLSYLGFQHLGG